MCIYPHVQLAAQADLDNVIGSERLPCISDRAQLPYIDAIVKEVLRWAPVAPLGKRWHFCQSLIQDSAYLPFNRCPTSSDERRRLRGVQDPGRLCGFFQHMVPVFINLRRKAAYSFSFVTHQGNDARSRDISQPTRIPTWAILRCECAGWGRGEPVADRVWIRAKVRVLRVLRMVRLNAAGSVLDNTWRSHFFFCPFRWFSRRLISRRRVTRPVT